MGAKLGGSGFDDINLTPLIDIVLVVLIIMMVNVPIEINEMGVKMPPPVEIEQPPPDPDAKTLVIGAFMEDDELKLMLNRHLMPEDVLVYEVSRRLKGMAKKQVYVDAGPTVTYGSVIDLVDAAREAGAAHVGLSKVKPEGPPRPVAVYPGAMPKGAYLGNVRVVGYITEVDAAASCERIKPAIQQCYNAGLAEQPDLTGRILLRTGVYADGSTVDAEVKNSTLKNSTAQNCFNDVLTQWKFKPLGKAEATALVDCPFLFSPGR